MTDRTIELVQQEAYDEGYRDGLVDARSRVNAAEDQVKQVVDALRDVEPVLRKLMDEDEKVLPLWGTVIEILELHKPKEEAAA